MAALLTAPMHRWLPVTLLVAAGTVGGLVQAAAPAANVTASSVHSADFSAANAVDGDPHPLGQPSR